MFARFATLPLATLAASPTTPPDPLTRPIVTDRTAEWLAARPPPRVFGNADLVGFGGLNVALINTDRGLILIDGALPPGGARDPGQCHETRFPAA